MTSSPATWTVLDRDNLIVQARLGHRYGLRLARFYRRLAMTLRWIQLLAGGAVFLTVFGDKTKALQLTGLLVAVASALDLAWDPSDKAAQCERNAERWADLDARAATLSDSEFSRLVVELTAVKAPTIDALINPVFNDLMRTFGRDDAIQPESWFQRTIIRNIM